MFIATTFYRLLKSHHKGTNRIAPVRGKSLPKFRWRRDNNQLLLSAAGLRSGKVAAVHSSGCWPGPVYCCVCAPGQHRPRIRIGSAPFPGWARIPGTRKMSGGEPRQTSRTFCSHSIPPPERSIGVGTRCLSRGNRDRRPGRIRTA
jgi:hypothetical protein